MASVSEFHCPCFHRPHELVDVGLATDPIPYYLLFVGNCGHGFHQSCAERMIGRRPACPACGQNIVDSASRVFDNAGNVCVRDSEIPINFKISKKNIRGAVEEFESRGVMFMNGAGDRKHPGILLYDPVCLGTWYRMGNTIPRRLYLLSTDRTKILMDTFVPALGRIAYYGKAGGSVKFTIEDI